MSLFLLLNNGAGGMGHSPAPCLGQDELMNILIADSQSKVQFALSVLLQEHSGWVVTGVAQNSEDLLYKADKLKPDVVLVDWSLPGLRPAELLKAVHQLPFQPHVIVLSTDPEIRQRALAMGADYFISKVDPPNKLLEALALYEQ